MSDKEDSDNVKERLQGKPYLWKDIYYCIFDNTITFPHSLSFLCRIKVYNEEGGLVYVTNPERRTYKEKYVATNKELDFDYKDIKKITLSRTGINLGFEGRILNDWRYS